MHIFGAYTHRQRALDLEKSAGADTLELVTTAAACVLSANSALEALFNEAYEMVSKPDAFGDYAAPLAEKTRVRLSASWKFLDKPNYSAKARVARLSTHAPTAVRYRTAQGPTSRDDWPQHFRVVIR